MNLYFDARTWLPLAQERTSAEDGKQPKLEFYKGYKHFGDLLLYTALGAMGAEGESGFTFELIEFNEVDASIFVVPSNLRDPASSE